jgi:DoxX-like family
MAQTNLVSRKNVWASRIVGGLPALFLLLDGAMKLVKPAVVVDATVKLGYPESTIIPIGLVLIVCTILYLIPTTAVLGAILLTGYLGGAVATHVRVGESLFSIIFPVIFGVMLWLALSLNDPRLRALLPLRSRIAQS